MPVDPLQTASRSGRLRRVGRGVIWLSVVAAMLVGIQLGGVPWRYRKQLWQLQGLLVGAAVGYLIGRLDRGESGQGPP